MLSVVEESGSNLLNMVREVLDRESKKTEPETLDYSTVQVSELLERVISMNKAKSVVKEISLSYKVQPNKLQAVIDENKVEIAVNNLVANALKFTPSKGKIRVKASLNDDHLLFEVKDTGIGIPKKNAVRSV
ncbi:sensor histidine kinase [Gracilimonas halophila]|uniref:histidine kinase n=1 Tax=Gracilimonas halophila TaxID=1834464 RepID=A0ABW5JLL5_9BACT